MMISNLPEKIHPALEEYFTNNPSEQSKTVADLLTNLQKREKKIGLKISSYNLSPNLENLNQVKKVAGKILALIKLDLSPYTQSFNPKLLSSYKKQLKSLQERLIPEDQIIDTEEILDWEAPAWDPKSIEAFDKAVKEGKTAIKPEKAIDFCIEALSLARFFKDKAKTLQSMRLLAEAYVIPQEEPLDKQQKRLIQTAGMYNYCLRLASEEEKEPIKQELSKIEQALLNLCKAKSQEQDLFSENRTQLKKFRDKIDGKIQQLPEEPDPQEVFELHHEIAEGMKGFTRELIKQAIENLEPPPSFAVIGFGSLAREEMTPYSDLEFGILIEKDTDENKQYFKNLTYLLHLKIVNLGETILPALNIPPLKDFYDDIIPRGFSFDGEGVQGKGCKTPFGNGETFELIQTPEKMAQYVGKDDKGEWWFEKEPHLPMELLNYKPILDESELSKKYGSAIQKELELQVDEKRSLREYLAKIHLVQEDEINFDPSLRKIEEEGKLFQIKKDLYRLPQLTIERLALCHGIKENQTCNRLQILGKRGILTEENKEKLLWLISQTIFQRLKVYDHYKAQKEWMNPLLKTFKFDDPALVQREFALDKKALETLTAMYQILIPLSEALQDFFGGDMEVFRKKTLWNETPNTLGTIACRLLQYEQAKEYFLKAIDQNGNDSYAYNELGIIYVNQGNIFLALENAEKALEIDLKLFGDESPQVAINYNNIALIYQDQGNMPLALENAEKALEINQKLFEDLSPQVAIYYNNIAMIYKDQGNMPLALENAEKALEIFQKLFEGLSPQLARGYRNIAVIYKAQGNMPLALENAEKALEIAQKLFGDFSPQVARDYNNIAMIYKDQGNMPLALENAEKALEIEQKLFGDESPQVAIYYNNIATIYQDQGNMPLALENAEKALKIDLKLFGDESPQVARDYNNIATIYQDQGNMPLALKNAEKALEIDLKLFGNESPQVAICYNNIALVYKAQGNMLLALENAEKALKIDLKLFGDESPQVARDYNNIAMIYQDQGNVPLALKNAEKALEIEQKLFGNESPQVAICYNNIALIYQDQGNLAIALENAKKALKIDLKLFEDLSPQVARDYNNIAMIYQDQGNMPLALKNAEKALEIEQNLFGNESPQVAGDYNNIAMIYKDQGNMLLALENAKKALKIDLKLFEDLSPQVAIYYNNIAMIYKDQGNMLLALENAKKTLEIDQKLFGDESSQVATGYNNIAMIYKDQGNMPLALENAKKALGIFQKLFGCESHQVATGYNNIALIYQDQGNLAIALENAEKALKIDQKLFEDLSPQVAIYYNNIATIYKAQGNMPLALENVKKSLEIDQKLFGDESSQVARGYNNIAMIYQDQGNMSSKEARLLQLPPLRTRRATFTAPGSSPY